MEDESIQPQAPAVITDAGDLNFKDSLSISNAEAVAEYATQHGKAGVKLTMGKATVIVLPFGEITCAPALQFTPVVFDPAVTAGAVTAGEDEADDLTPEEKKAALAEFAQGVHDAAMKAVEDSIFPAPPVPNLPSVISPYPHARPRLCGIQCPDSSNPKNIR